MKIVDLFRELNKLVVETINPEYIRIDPLPEGAYISCGAIDSDVIMSARLHDPIECLTESVVMSSPKLLRQIFEAPPFRNDNVSVVYKGDADQQRYFLFSNGRGYSTKMLVIGDHLDNFAKRVRTPPGPWQLVMPVTALWKQQFEYWSNFESEESEKCHATFFRTDGSLSCLVGDYKFDHHVWRCDAGSDAGFVSAIEFRCSPMVKVLRLFPHVRRMSISVSTNALMQIRAETNAADYYFYLSGAVPHWYATSRSPAYDVDDPRSAILQRQDES